MRNYLWPPTIDTHKQALQESSQKLEDVAEDSEELKNQLVAVVIELQSERTAIADRFKVVLDELDKKGGNSATHRNYIEASDGIVIDFKDIEGLGILLVNWIKSEEGGLRLFITLDSRPHYAIYETLHLHSTSTFDQIPLAIELIQKVAAENDYIKGARPVFSDFNDYAFDIKLVFWIKKWGPEEKEVFPNDLWKISMVRSQMNLGILQQFEAHGLKLALPIQLKDLPQSFRDGVYSLNSGNCQNSIGKIEGV